MHEKNLFLRIRVILLTCLLLTKVPSTAQEVTIGGEVRMLALGDSYTIGESVAAGGRWPHQLVDTIRSLGISAAYPDYIARTGWTTQNLIQGIHSMLDEEKDYNLVSILIGVNNQYQGISIDSYEPDLREIIELALGVVDHDTSRLLILSIPDYAYTPFGNGNSSISQEIDRYNAIKNRVAGEYGIAFIDITPISREGLNDNDLVASDGLHPSALQYGLWVEAVVPRFRMEGNLSGRDQRRSEEEVRIFPNPASTSLQIDSSLEVSRVSIHNSLGQLVKEKVVSALPFRIDLHRLVPGIYTLLVYHKREGMISRKSLIIQAD